MCLVETERTEKAVWSSERKLCKSVKETFFISARSFSNFKGVFAGKLKPVELLPLNKIKSECYHNFCIS